SFGVQTSSEGHEDLVDLDPSYIYPVLLRATDGKKFKVSTLVEDGELEGFFQKYAEVCKLGMKSLKKKERKKTKAKGKKKS
ncbi:hypothetical protein NEOLI_005074, partial [Neolecta irregularis DAH-3]